MLADLSTALRFLTRIPIPGRVVGADLSGAAGWFPVVGLVVAGIVVATRAGFEPLIGIATATLFAVGAGVVVTGAMHEDAVGDAADGLWGGSTPARRLAIMRDSRLGTYGVLAATGTLGAQVLLLAQLQGAGFVRAVVASHTLARFAALPLAAAIPPARSDGAAVHAGRVRPRAWVVATTTCVLVAGATHRTYGLLLAGAMLAVTAVVGRLARTRVGGITGDLLGAAVSASTVAVMLVAVVLDRAGR
jgi:adenosylcobinamide-GDP ribazoletransferase